MMTLAEMRVEYDERRENFNRVVRYIRFHRIAESAPQEMVQQLETLMLASNACFQTVKTASDNKTRYEAYETMMFIIEQTICLFKAMAGPAHTNALRRAGYLN